MNSRERRIPNWIERFAPVMCLIVLAGCATIISGRKQDVSIFSEPTAANVSIDGFAYGRTPLMVHMDRGKRHTVKIELEGYEPYGATIGRGFNGWFLLNVPLMPVMAVGVIGMVIDFGTGAVYSLSPDEIEASLDRANAKALLRDDTLYVSVTLNPDPSWQKVGQLTPKRAP